MNIDNISKNSEGQYMYTDFGCGCCSSDNTLTLEELNDYIKELKSRLEKAFIIKSEMENG